MTLDNDTLVALAEVSVGLTGFIGIVTVLGSRSQGEWSPLDNIRFWSLMLSSLTPIALALLPVLFGPASLKPVGLIVGGIWSAILIYHASIATRIPKASTNLAIFVISCTLLVYSTFVASALGLVQFKIQQCYLAQMFWCLTIAIIFFVRLLRSVRPAA